VAAEERATVEYASRGAAAAPAEGFATPPNAWQKEAPPGPARWRRLVLPALLGLLPVAAAGLLALWVFNRVSPQPPPAFTLDLKALGRLALKAGEVRRVDVGVRRDKFSGPIRLTVAEHDPGLRIVDGEGPQGNPFEGATLPGDDETVTVRVMALPDAKPGTAQVKILASAGDVQQEGAVDLSVGPLCYKLPEGWQPVPDSAVKEVDGRVYFERIDVVRDGIPVRFLLIPSGEREAGRKEPGSIPTFYIMEDKVWLGLFKRFAETLSEKSPAHPWEYRDPLVNKKDDHPVMGVSLANAILCARWLGGKVPLPQQWDKASGAFDKPAGEGPFLGPFVEDKDEIAVGRVSKGTMQRHTAVKDISPFGVRDMAGNGWEWTDRAAEDPQGRISDGDFQAFARSVRIRGKGWNEPKPYHFKDSEEGTSFPLKDPKEEGTSSGGAFRVVLEP
jgi:hypothetical protein